MSAETARLLTHTHPLTATSVPPTDTELYCAVSHVVMGGELVGRGLAGRVGWSSAARKAATDWLTDWLILNSVYIYRAVAGVCLSRVWFRSCIN